MDIRESVRIDCPEMKERTIDQFLKKWDNLSREAKKEGAAAKKSIGATGKF